ncbi:MAG: prepilin-type N-terminal cleavage/methylation domain-containing protein [Proteobacteria bacterium]|nr:prepilin-type N-terminal cleavage/methylation domain-containing protein [Pseudomonadota bacterium]
MTIGNRAAQRARKGFTLLESLIVIGLVGIAFAIGFTAVHTWRSRTGVRAAAQRLLADLSWARQHAMATGLPTGLMFAQTAASPGYQVVRARDDISDVPDIERDVLWDESDGLVSWSGSWDGLPFSATYPPSIGAADARLDAWVRTLGAEGRRCLIFRANGTTMGENIPHVDGERYLAVCSGLRYSADHLDAAGPSYTVRVSSLGGLSLIEGLPGKPVAAEPQPRPALGGLSAHLAPPRSVNHDPEIDAPIEITPLPNQSLLPSGADAQVRQDGSLSLVITASDADGDPLWCAFGSFDAGPLSDTPPSHPDGTVPTQRAGGGVWSVGGNGPEPMHYDSTRERWVATAEWYPPREAPLGSWFSLGVRVTDGRGGSSTRWLVIQITPPGGSRLCYCKVPDDWYYVVDNANVPQFGGVTLVASAVGTEETRLPDYGRSWIQYPLLFSHDGNWLLTQSVYIYVEGPSNRAPRLRLIDVDSGDVVTMPGLDEIARTFAAKEHVEVLDLSPDGSHVLYHRTGPLVEGAEGACTFSDTDGSGLYIASLDGDNREDRRLTTHALTSPVQARFGPAGHVAAIAGRHLMIWDPGATSPADACHPTPPPTAVPSASSTPSPPPVMGFRWRSKVNQPPSIAIAQDGEIYEAHEVDGHWLRDTTLVTREVSGGSTGLVAISGNDQFVAWTARVPVRRYVYTVESNDDSAGSHYALRAPVVSTAHWMLLSGQTTPTPLDDVAGLLWLPDFRQIAVWKSPGDDQMGPYELIDLTNGTHQTLVQNAASLVVQPPRTNRRYNSY